MHHYDFVIIGAGIAGASMGWELAGQRRVLAPLERDWNGLDRVRRDKWLVIADRYPGLAAEEQSRISARMTEWSRLSPKERGEVRLRYQESRQLPAPDRSARWEA